MTVGTVLPFDRLIRLMDDWSRERPEAEVRAQIGSGSFEPEHMQWTRTMTPPAFEEAIRAASLIVAHAGVGSVIAAATAGKPIVILPRRQAAREHTSDHQVHTARRLHARPGVFVAMSEEELPAAIERAMLEAGTGLLPRVAPEPFVERIRQFLVSDRVRP